MKTELQLAFFSTSGHPGVQHFVQIGGLWNDFDSEKDELLIDWKVNQACNSHVQSCRTFIVLSYFVWLLLVIPEDNFRSPRHSSFFPLVTISQLAPRLPDARAAS